MQKNTASQYWVVFAFEDEGGTNPGEPVTGDAANHSASIRIDGSGTPVVLGGTPTELSGGYYRWDVGATGTNGDHLTIIPSSSTANVNVIGVPGSVWTTAPNFSAFDISAGGDVNLQTGAVTAAVIATGAIDADAFAANAITSTVVADSTITSAKFAAQAITSAVIDSNAIDASKLAANTIGASELATDAVDEIADAVWDEVLTAGTHDVANSAGRRIRNMQEFDGYGGSVWIDTVNGTAGTTDYENGTASNPVSTIADANTIAASIGLSRFQVAPGSTITFTASQTDQIFIGHSWNLLLGGQNIDGTTFIGATTSGIGTNTTGRQYFIGGEMGICTLPGDTTLERCGIKNTITLGEADDYYFDACYSQVAGSGTPTLDFGSALTASNVSFRHYSGGIEIENMGAGAGTYNMSLEGNGQLVINVNCSATSNISIRGNFTITNNATGITITDDARYDLGRTLTEAYATDGSEATQTELLYMIWSAVSQYDISSTTITSRKLDGTTLAMTFNMDSATDPTSRVRNA